MNTDIAGGSHIGHGISAIFVCLKQNWVKVDFVGFVLRLSSLKLMTNELCYTSPLVYAKMFN